MSEHYEIYTNIPDLSFMPPVLAILKVCGGFEIHFIHPMPNRWFRLWQRVFLGFTWRKP